MKKKTQFESVKKTKKKKTNDEKERVKEMCPWWCQQKESFSSKLSRNNPFFYRFKKQEPKKERVNIGGQMKKDKVKEDELIRTLVVRLISDCFFDMMKSKVAKINWFFI